MELLPHIEVETNLNPKASVIWLHGLGANGHDFEPIVPELRLPSDAAVRFIFPHAPAIPVTINNGMSMPAWFDILEMNLDRQVDKLQLRKSAMYTSQFIENEVSRGIPSELIVLAGFSQGGAVVLETALSYPKKLAGLLAMSTYFATKDSIQLSDQNKQIPVELHHGLSDPMVPISLAHITDETLKQSNYNVNMKTYPMEHSVCPQQVRDIGQWLTTVLEL